MHVQLHFSAEKLCYIRNIYVLLHRQSSLSLLTMLKSCEAFFYYGICQRFILISHKKIEELLDYEREVFL